MIKQERLHFVFYFNSQNETARRDLENKRKQSSKTCKKPYMKDLGNDYKH